MNAPFVIEKAIPSAGAALLGLLARISPLFRRTFERFLASLSNSEDVRNVVEAYQQGDLLGAVQDFITAHATDLWNAWESAFEQAGDTYANHIEAQVRTDAAKWASGETPAANELNILRGKPPADFTTQFQFNPGAFTAQRMLEDYKLDLIRGLSDQQVELVRNVLGKYLGEGANPLEAARELRDVIGLTPNQWQYVENYRSALQANSRQALDRVLRDRRFDRSVERALADDEPLTSQQIERMVQAYTRRMIAYRAKTVARTEMLRAAAMARQESWRQMLAKTGGDPKTVIRTWIATLDDKTRDSHWEMNRQQVIGFDTPFVSPSGEQIQYPHDPMASPEETINCRCTDTILIRDYL